MPKACFRGVMLSNSTSISLADKKIKLGLIGARIDGQAGVVLDVLSHFKNIEVVAFFDNTAELKGSYINGIPVVGCICRAADGWKCLFYDAKKLASHCPHNVGLDI